MFRLPPSPQDPSMSDPPTKGTRTPYTVLVVEDDQDHAALIEAVFTYRSFPCTVHVAGSSEEAMDYLLGRWPFDNRHRHPTPHIIILDLGLPGMGGLDFMRWLEEREEAWSTTPVVVFTANQDRSVAAQATALGAREVKVKPSDFGELVDTVEHVLRRWRPPNVAS